MRYNKSLKFVLLNALKIFNYKKYENLCFIFNFYKNKINK